jgi:PAS domain S-box-containing protein
MDKSKLHTFFSTIHQFETEEESIQFTLKSILDFSDIEFSIYTKKMNDIVLQRITEPQKNVDIITIEIEEDLIELIKKNNYYTENWILSELETITTYSSREIENKEDINFKILILKECLYKLKLERNNKLTYSFNKKHEQRLNLLENFLKNTKDAIQVADLSGQLIYLNKEASERLGIDLDRIHDYRVSDFEPSFKDKNVWLDHIEVIRKSGTFSIESYNVHVKTKARIAVEIVVTIQEFDGKEYVIAASRNIEERVKNRKALEEAKQIAEENARFKDEFIAKISHEIRTPLNGILGLTRELEKNNLPKEIEDKIKLIRTSGKELSHVFNEVLEQYKLNTQQLNPNYLSPINKSTNTIQFRDKKILLVEDNIINRIVAKSTLSILQCDIIECENGQLAIDYLTNTLDKIDLILMDIQMPILDGFQTSRKIRDELHLTIPIIALTANAFHLDASQYTKYGINDCVFKPYDEISFTEKISYYLNQSTERQYKLDYLKKITYEDKEVLHEIIQLFYESISFEIEKINVHFNENNYILFKQTIHKLKPNIFNFRIEKEFENIEILNTISEVDFQTIETKNIITQLCETLAIVKAELNQDFKLE